MEYCQLMGSFSYFLFDIFHHFFHADLMKIFVLNHNFFKNMVLMKNLTRFFSGYMILFCILLHSPD